MNERTPAGTVRCEWCGLEWLSDDLDGHADPQCLMHLFTIDPAGDVMLVGSTQQGDQP